MDTYTVIGIFKMVLLTEFTYLFIYVFTVGIHTMVLPSTRSTAVFLPAGCREAVNCRY